MTNHAQPPSCNRTSIPSNACFPILITAYTAVLLISNWFAPRIISFGHMTLPGGFLFFPFTFVLSDIITEVYGFRNARLSIWIAFFFNALFLLYGVLIIPLSNPAQTQSYTDAFNLIFTLYQHTILASFISYIFSEFFNTWVLSTLKQRFQGRFMPLRMLLSTVLAAGIDSILFCTIAFFHLFPLPLLIKMILFIWITKITIEIIMLPCSVFCAQRIKIREKIDIYDSKININIFSLDTTYHESENRYPHK